MAYELQRTPAPQRLAEALGGTSAEFRELSFGKMQAAMRVGGDRGHASEALLAASLHVDGNPVTLDAVLDAPGRFSGVLTDAIATVIRMHGLVVGGDVEVEPVAVEGADAPKH
jgi:hypothetical protein